MLVELLGKLLSLKECPQVGIIRNSINWPMIGKLVVLEAD